MDSTDILLASLFMIGLSAGKTLADKGIAFSQYSWKPLMIAGVLVGGFAAFKEL